MKRTVGNLGEQLKGIRPGTLSVGFVETFRVAVDGRSTPIGRIAALASERDRIVVTPFDANLVPAVVKALVDSRLNAYALDRGRVCVSVPPVSGEQRAQIVRHVKTLGEEAKVAIRLTRQSARKEIAARGRGSQHAVQEATDAAVAEVERLVSSKIADLGK